MCVFLLRAQRTVKSIMQKPKRKKKRNNLLKNGNLPTLRSTHTRILVFQCSIVKSVKDNLKKQPCINEAKCAFQMLFK